MPGTPTTNFGWPTYTTGDVPDGAAQETALATAADTDVADGFLLYHLTDGPLHGPSPTAAEIKQGLVKPYLLHYLSTTDASGYIAIPKPSGTRSILTATCTSGDPGIGTKILEISVGLTQSDGTGRLWIRASSTAGVAYASGPIRILVTMWVLL